MPNVNLTDYFNQRVASSDAGVPFTDPITFVLGGKANNGPGYYKQDWNNWAPSVSFAWSPDFGDNFARQVSDEWQERRPRRFPYDLRSHRQRTRRQFRF